jgi:hypothetical protein
MKDDRQIKGYAKGIIQTLRSNLRNNIDIVIAVTPSEGPGGVVEVQLLERRSGFRKSNKGILINKASATVNEALAAIPQSFTDKNQPHVEFRGTNISMEKNRIVFIKGDNDHWSEDDATKDVNKAINPRLKVSS